MSEALQVIGEPPQLSPVLDQPFAPALPEEYKEWPEYRDFIRRFRCIVCQATNGKNHEGEHVEDDLYVPEIVYVSDPHHVVTRGAGGPDAENLVPLCRYHHSEQHNMGRIRFELKYNIDLKGAANLLFVRFMDSFKADEHQAKVKAQHQLIISRIHSAREGFYAIGKMLMDFIDSRFGGKRSWDHLGFQNFEAYVSAPISAGGLGLAVRTAWRYLAYARGHSQYSTEKASLLDVDVTKAQTILPLLKEAKTEAEREEIIETAKHMTTADLISWKHEKQGTEDPKEAIHRDIVEFIRDLFDTVGAVQLDEEATEAVAWRLYRIATGRKSNEDV